MHLSHVCASLAAIATASAAVIPRIIPSFGPGFGNLPQIPPNCTKVLGDLDTMKGAFLGLENCLSSGSDIKSPLDIPDVMTNTINVQSATRESMLDAQELTTVFSADESRAVLNKIKNDIIPLAQTALSLLNTAKEKNLLNAAAAKFVILPYLNITENEYDTFTTALLEYIDAGSKADVAKALQDLRNILASTITVYTP